MSGILLTTVGANLKPFVNNLRSCEGIARSAGARIRVNLAQAGTGAVESIGKINGMNLVLRETLVIFREIGRGNWSRVPGSLSLVVQGLVQMRDKLGPIGALFTWTGAAVVGAIGSIVGAFFIWEYRVKKLTEALTGLQFPDLKPPDISKLSSVETAWRKIADAAREAAAEVGSANYAFENNKKAMDESYETQKKLLEISKQKALAESGGNLAKEAAIRADFAKKEHNLEKKHMEDSEKLQEEHIKALENERDAAKNDPKARGYRTEADEASITESLKANAGAGTEKDKETGKSKLDEAQETVERMEFQKRGDIKAGFGGLSEEHQAVYDSAKETLQKHAEAKAAYEKNQREAPIRADARKQGEELQDRAANAEKGRIKAVSGLADTRKLNGQKLTGDDSVRAAEDDLAETKDKHKGKLDLGSVTNLQKVGAYSAPANTISAGNKLIAKKLDKIHEALKKPPAKHFGGVKH